MTKTSLNIGLLWHSATSGNLGVAALTVANMALVRGVADELGVTPRFTIIGMRDGMDAYVRPDEAGSVIVDTRAMINPRGCWAAIRAQDCILDIGGGDSFTDIYADRRFLFIWATKALAIAARRPLLLSPQTVGPFSRQPHTAAAAWAMSHAVAVIARDQASMDAIGKMAPKARRLLATDVAFELPFQDRSHERGGARPRVGINASGLLFTQALEGRDTFGLEVNYAALTRKLIEAFHAQGAEVHLITHCRDFVPSDDDGRVADMLAGEYPFAKRVPDFTDPRDAKSYISGLDFVVSGRMHACIGALSSGTPVVPIAYSRKFSGVFGLIDYPWMVDVAGKSTEQAVDFVMDCYARRTELAQNCKLSMTKVGGYLETYRNELRSLFTRLAKR